MTASNNYLDVKHYNREHSHLLSIVRRCTVMCDSPRLPKTAIQSYALHMLLSIKQCQP